MLPALRYIDLKANIKMLRFSNALSMPRNLIKFSTLILLVVILLSATALIVLLPKNVTKNLASPEWVWKCSNDQCLKIRFSSHERIMSMSECKLLCLPYATIWPHPTGSIEIAKHVTQINASDVNFLQEYSESIISNLVTGATKRFLSQMRQLQSLEDQSGSKVSIRLNIKDQATTRLSLDTEEGYYLAIYKNESGAIDVVISSENFFGARHALETLTQLVTYDDLNDRVIMISAASISDKPMYAYRGVMMDTARHYITVNGIKRTIEGMAMAKLNSFHWHLTDAQSFPYVSNTQPKFSKLGAFSPRQIYTGDDIKQIVEFATIRGIRVIPELDAPNHVGEGWQDSGVTVSCANTDMDVCMKPCIQLDPTNDKVYDILEDIYNDLLSDFEPDMFHMGGDEVSLLCWTNNDQIAEWMMEKRWMADKEHGINLWNIFQTEAYKRLSKHLKKDTPIILWYSDLTSEKYISNKTYIVQVWNSKSDTNKLLQLGFRIILSRVDHLYLDCGPVPWCSNYNTWERIYEYRPSLVIGKVTMEESKLILGAEVAAWSERIDESYLDSRIWPRASSMAEVLWSEPTINTSQAKQRFYVHRDRLIMAGIGAEALENEWCVQNDGECLDL